LEIAVDKFKGHLPTYFVKGFNKAWIKYYNDKEEEGWQDYFQYMPIQGESCSFGKTIYKYDNTKAYKDNFKKNVDGLLKYAKQI
ncbi:MAG: hypothetical protein Q8M34_11735, partial [Thermodesulfovibrionales bacterium]|nr:hypothetical protein [Thermodesulfovibrionales bacterium]